ncbi:MAG TPA: M28 family peptidase [Vicinamibacteria bacterium]|jgi:N-acetylated-alpha-linked acidic dipeptidase
MILPFLFLLLTENVPLGFFPGSAARQLEAERVLLSIPSPEGFGAHLLYLTEEPHPAGSKRNMELADYVRDRFLEYGLEDVHFHDTPALYSYGREASVDILEPVELSLKLKEDPHPEDKDSYLYSEPGVVPYHEYAASGEVEAQVVYANGGSPEDFARLREMGVDVRGKIAIVRYSNPYSYRGYKVHLAESSGALGVIIYSDPADDGYARGETYPRGPWGPPSHIQWGSIVYDWLGYGTIPFTFHWKKNSDGSWVEGPERDRQLPRIPSIPMSHEDASEILSRLAGPAVPREWQGALPFTYHVGPGPVRLRLRVKNEERIGLMRNVIGKITGSEEPDKWVVVGNHRDAWSHGAVDPSSGTAALLETARALGAAVKHGYRPRRTIVFANWDAEEDLLGGSTSWAVDFRDKLRRDGVLYVNVDSAASGPNFSGGATPALADYLRDVSRYVPHPSAPTFYDAWRARKPESEPEVGTIVGATDYTAFQENIGMSVIDLSSNGPYGVYHSQYDNYFWLSRIADPGFLQNAALSRLLAVLAHRTANAEFLPMRYSAYARAVLEHLDEVEKKAAPARELRLSAAREAARLWGEKAQALEARMWQRELPRENRARFNALLMEVERALIEDRGLKSRPFFKHLIYAPQPTYRDEVLPRIWEAIDQGAWGEIEGYERELVAAFERAGSLLDEAASLLER